MNGEPKKKRRRKTLPVTTPRSIIRHALRLLWMRSRERLAALKRDGYTCQECHRKQSKAIGREFSVEVHHLRAEEDIDWDGLIEYLQRHLLCEPSKLVTLCPDCHMKEHQNLKEVTP
jgi:5-methylcytosine-specific restriction endonuclease McrA